MEAGEGVLDCLGRPLRFLHPPYRKGTTVSDLAKYRTKKEWESKNPILFANEPGFEEDTGKLKIGDGTKRWNSLAYVDAAPYTLPQQPFSFGSSSPVDLASVPSLEDLERSSRLGTINANGTVRL